MTAVKANLTIIIDTHNQPLLPFPEADEPGPECGSRVCPECGSPIIVLDPRRLPGKGPPKTEVAA